MSYSYDRTAGVVRMTIRPTVYRDEEGFALAGKNKSNQSISIFVKKRETAEKIRDLYKGAPDWEGDIDIAGYKKEQKRISEEIGRLIEEDGKHYDRPPRP